MTSLNESTLQLLSLIRQYLELKGRNDTAPDIASDADINEIFRLAAYNNCDTFVYHIMYKLAAEYGVDEAVLKKYKNRVLLTGIAQMRANAELKEVIQDLNAANVKFIILKGVILSSIYPHPEYRRSTDADIHVDDENAERAAAVILARGYVYIQNPAIKYERTYRLNGVLTIELHTKLFEEFYEKNRAVIAEIGLDSPDYHREVKVLGVFVETLPHSQFLTYVICHHTKHFISNGINIRHLMDICVYVNEYAEHLDWEFIRYSLNKLGIWEFTVNLLFICQHWLGMTDVSFLYGDVGEETALLLLYDIAERDAVSDGFLERGSARDIIKDVYYHGGGKIGIMSNVAPGTKVLNGKYDYAKKYPVLLPVAWIHRAFSYLWRRLTRKKVITPSERAKLAADRIELLKRVGIL